jgi:hypothetical protein
MPTPIGIARIGSRRSFRVRIAAVPAAKAITIPGT